MLRTMPSAPQEAAERSAEGSAVKTDPPSIVILAADGEILEVNGTWRRYSEENHLPWDCHSVGRNYLGVCDAVVGEDAEDAHRAADGLRSVLAGARQEFSMEYTCRAPTGPRRFVLSASLLSGAEGERRALLVHQDITEHHQEAHARRSLEGQLLQARKMESLGQLASGVAHDFSNLLMVIFGQCDLLEERLMDDEIARELVAEVRWAGERGSSLARQLLAFGRKQPCQPTSVDLGQILREIEPMLRRLLGAHIHFVIRLADRPTPIYADRSQIEQVVINLAVNGRDAMPRGGELRIEASVEELDGEEALRMSSNPEDPGAAGNYVRLRVRDHGVGIDATDLPHIFEPFFTTKRKGRGTGLGLAAVYGITCLHRGLIDVRSIPELTEGTIFDIYLPYHPAKAPSTAPAENRKEMPRGRETILLVEDDDDVRRVSRRMLEKLGYDVLEANDHVAATEWAKRHAGPIDLIVTDIVMPQMSGPELVAKLHTIRSGLPTLYISGYAGEALENQVIVEKSAFLQKPVRQHELAHAVRALLDERAEGEPDEPGEPAAG